MLKMILHSILAVWLSVMFAVTGVCFCKTPSDWIQFHRLDELSQPYNTVKDISRLKCALVCSKDESCIAFSHHEEAARCKLVEETGVQQETDDVGWKFFTSNEPTGKSCKKYFTFEVDKIFGVHSCNLLF